MLDLCLPCKEKGKFRAPYKMIKGVPMCGGCVADYEANPPKPAQPDKAVQFLGEVKNEKEEKTMAKRIEDEVRQEILKDHAAGMTTNAIATKHGVGWITAKTVISATGGKRAGGGNSSPAAKRAAKATRAPNGASRFADIVAQLREERERIDRVIADLEQMS
jgi:hypothetical protein